jgi:hypothetical protein
MQNETPTYHSADFRTYPPFTTKDGYGKLITLQRCESLEEGRWESFVSIVAEEEA